MRKSSEVCRECGYAAVCYGLGLRVVLQMCLDRSDGRSLQEYAKRALPSECPEYVEGEWVDLTMPDHARVVARVGDLVNVSAYR